MHSITFLDRATLAPHIHLRRPRFAHRWQEYAYTAESDIVARAADSTIVITNKVPFNRSTLAVLPKLKLIAVAATGTNIIDKNYCRERGIEVINVPAYATHSVTEHTFALILSLQRQLPAYRNAVSKGSWQNSPVFCLLDYRISELHNSRLGIVGGGHLGQALAKIARAFGMHVNFSERKHQSPSGRPHYLSFDEILHNSDIVSLHCPLTEETRNLIGAAELEAMKKTALLINTARGELVDENALAHALKQQWIAGAALDVIQHEPIQKDNPLLELSEQPNFIMTPHIAWASDQAMQTLADRVIENIERFVTEQR